MQRTMLELGRIAAGFAAGRGGLSAIDDLRIVEATVDRRAEATRERPGAQARRA